jgi:Tubulin binding cofactor A.
MAPPSPLVIATQALNRLVKEESYYHKELASQEKRIKKLEDDIASNSPDLDSNAEYILKQEVCQALGALPNTQSFSTSPPTLTLNCVHP